ncbi:UNVERIFIED_CONTAM: protein WHAT'S THIS FACTOR 1, chloroplastic [Sesamum calycinum]|uniref:Protein WHAT'S THIS FACTOR 1, chloroplastic n=1 Tax=Sesamum calycinum TaxID=2727403 RepID=A0AAW2JC13_9LAMI
MENELESKRVDAVRKLLMMSANKRIPLSKIYHNRLLFGIPEDFRDRVAEYPDYFRVVIEDDGKRVLELVNWDSSLAVSALEKEFMVDEDKVKRAFKFPMKHGKALDLDMEDERKLNILNTLPLVSPYSDGMLLKQPRTFYVAGTQMNWCVFLKDAYGEDGELINKDPQVVFNEKLYKYVDMQELESDALLDKNENDD